VNHPALRTVRAGGLDIGYLDEGRGPVILLVHGFPDIATTFVPLMERLAAAGHRVIAPWLRGYYPTTSGRFFDEGTLVADAIALLEALGIDRVDAVGHDWGADVVYGLGAVRSDSVRTAVAMAVPHTVALRANRRKAYRQLQRSFYVWMFQVSGLAETVVPEADWAFIRNLWRDWSPGWQPPEEHIRAVVETLSRPGVLAAVLSYYRALFDPGLRDPERAELLAAVEEGPVRVPTLLLMGANDGCVGREMAEGAEAAFEADYRLESLGGVGHFLHLEKPDRVAGLVLRWIDR
jgi:pimeloyl-ACP methyl ester carboxylesterase